MAFIEPMHRNKPNITYLLTSQRTVSWKMAGSGIYLTQIMLTRYMMFPVFAIRFTAYAGGILVSFIQLHLFLFDIECSAWEIYHID